MQYTASQFNNNLPKDNFYFVLLPSLIKEKCKITVAYKKSKSFFIDVLGSEHKIIYKDEIIFKRKLLQYLGDGFWTFHEIEQDDKTLSIVLACKGKEREVIISKFVDEFIQSKKTTN